MGNVSDHALVRWLERKHGLDVKRMKQDIWAEVEEAKKAGVYQKKRGHYVEGGGLVYVLSKDEGVLITILEEGMF